ncbi:MAG TPA: FAD-binding oxidoreductase [Verrucomicrobiae bacterium]|jgi:glycine/D-amino acid oxidase-like deaminating enzyme|nr:FAD-binding oxidoreductase [Verrucomicrobiae bacterium]
MAAGLGTADAVVIGSGAFGSSTAYHLARRGLKVALVDQHALGSQTSPRAAGLTSKADTMPAMARLRHEACEALERFESEMGRSVDFHRSGSLRAAYTDGGVERVRIAHETATTLRIEARLIDAAEAGRLAPHFEPGAARRILHVPSDGWVDPARVAIGFATRAGEVGARLLPFTAVQGLLSEDGRAAGVMTARGPLHAPVVVDAAGGWAARVAASAGIALPLVPVRHQLFVTETIAGVEPLQPIVRLVEASVYVRYEQGGLMFGGYEDAPRVLGREGLPPGFQIAALELDLGVLRGLVDEVAAHFPALRDAKVAVHRGGAPTMTPDGRPIVGRVPGLDGLFVASGCCVGGLSLSPAAGRVLADLIVDGKSDPDLAPLSVARFAGADRDPAGLEAACVAQYARRYTH